MTIVVRLPFMARKDPPAVMRVAGGTHFNQCSSTTALWLIRSHIGALVMAVIMLHSDSDFLSPSLFFFFFFWFCQGPGHERHYATESRTAAHSHRRGDRTCQWQLASWPKFSLQAAKPTCTLFPFSDAKCECNFYELKWNFPSLNSIEELGPPQMSHNRFYYYSYI